MSRHPSRVLLCVAALGLGLGLTSCGDGSDTAVPSYSSSPTTGSEGTAGSEQGTVIEVTVADGSVTPTGDRIEVGVGEEVVLAITADEPGELHVHTTEELTLAYPAGESEQVLVVDQPGVVDVESHDVGVVVVQLQVS